MFAKIFIGILVFGFYQSYLCDEHIHGVFDSSKTKLHFVFILGIFDSAAFN